MAYVCTFVGDDGKVCGRTYETEAALRSHRAWHVGHLKHFKKTSEVRAIATKKEWKKSGRDLTRGFLLSVLDKNLPELEELTKEIHYLIARKL